MRKPLWIKLIAVTFLDFIGPERSWVSIPKVLDMLKFPRSPGVRWVAKASPSKASQASVTLTTSDSYHVLRQAGSGLTNSS